jgi:hypothetical protein
MRLIRVYAAVSYFICKIMSLPCYPLAPIQTKERREFPDCLPVIPIVDSQDVRRLILIEIVGRDPAHEGFLLIEGQPVKCATNMSLQALSPENLLSALQANCERRDTVRA